MTPNEYSPVSHDVAYPALKAIREMAGVRPYPGAPPLAGGDACPWTEAAKQAGYVTKDSGKREEMPTGSVRDTREGKGRFELISPFALRRLAGVYERGAAKYACRNWEKGQPFSRFLDSALRHLNSFAMGWTDEDHLSQALWNVAAIIHFQELGRLELDDMPHYQSGPNDSPEARLGWAEAMAGFDPEGPH